MKKYLLFLLLGACVSTSPKQPVPQPVEPPKEGPVVVQPPHVPEAKPVPPVPMPAYPSVGWVGAYDDLIYSLVTENMIAQPPARMNRFCDAWIDLDRNERKQFYADLLYAIAYPESGYANLSMYVEDMGKDSKTGLPVVSEGLLSLSYQDVGGYPKCQFDWKKDLAALKDDVAGHKVGDGFTSHHPDRDTLNPYKNLACGAHIIDVMLKNYPSMEFADMMGKYWAVMKRANSTSYQKVWKKLRERKSPCE
jgi:hypothetical protein